MGAELSFKHVALIDINFSQIDILCWRSPNLLSFQEIQTQIRVSANSSLHATGPVEPKHELNR